MLDWITNVMNSLGYLGIVLLMFLETVIAPIPSEVIMPLAGFAAAQGKLELVYVAIAGMVGSVLGALPWYYVGRRLGEKRLQVLADRYGKWLGISGQDVENGKHWFDRHGAKAVLFCRLLPGVRTWISIPAGLSKMHLAPFLLYTAIGSLLWAGLLADAGYLLGDNYYQVEKFVERYIDPAAKVLIAALVLTVVWLVRRHRRNC